MEQSGEYRIPAPRERVWEALNDPEVLSACIDGCQSLTRVGDDRFEGVVRARIGPVNATFRGTVSLLDLQPFESRRARPRLGRGRKPRGRNAAASGPSRPGYC